MNDESINPYRTPESTVGIDSSVIDVVSRRKKLVPLWIKVFGWIFIVMGVVAPLGFIFSLLTGQASNFSLLGLQNNGSEISLMGVVIITLFVSFGISAYGLLFGRDWGLKAALATGYIGLAVSVFVMASVFATGVYTFRLEPLIQIPYLIKLHKIRQKWSNSQSND